MQFKLKESIKLRWEKDQSKLKIFHHLHSWLRGCSSDNLLESDFQMLIRIPSEALLSKCLYPKINPKISVRQQVISWRNLNFLPKTTRLISLTIRMYLSLTKTTSFNKTPTSIWARTTKKSWTRSSWFHLQSKNQLMTITILKNPYLILLIKLIFPHFNNKSKCFQMIKLRMILPRKEAEEMCAK